MEKNKTKTVVMVTKSIKFVSTKNIDNNPVLKLMVVYDCIWRDSHIESIFQLWFLYTFLKVCIIDAARASPYVISQNIFSFGQKSSYHKQKSCLAKPLLYAIIVWKVKKKGWNKSLFCILTDWRLHW